MVNELKKQIYDLLCKSQQSKHEVDTVMKAVDFAIKFHSGQKRKSGEPFIIHPLNVAIILINWNLDIPTICAGILHDVVEDTEAEISVIEKEFGEVVASLVEAVTKVSTFSSKNRADNKYSEDKELNNYLLKVFFGMSKDLRVMLIKLADRYHNMSTIKFLKPEKQRKIALETMQIYANIAGRLGMLKIKTDLCDMCLEILEPQEYKRVKAIIDSKVKNNGHIFDEAIERIANCLDNNHISYKLEHRIKSVYSTTEKLKNSDSMHDMFAIRVIVDQPLDCYLCLGIVHSNFYNTNNSFRDFISAPKINLYQSLHTIIVYKGLSIEIQIRTKEMNLNASYGVAAHWRYKEKLGKDLYLDSMISTIVESENDEEIEPLTLVKRISKQRFISVLDKNTMDLKTIPEGISVLDYVYILDKRKFPYSEQVIINDTKANMYDIIQSGDTVEVKYSNNKTIKPGWVYFTKDNTIKKYVHDQLQDINSNLENSVDAFVNNLMLQCGSYCKKKFILEFIQKHFNINSIKDFLDAMKYIKISSPELVQLFGNNWKERRAMIHKIQSLSWKWLVAKSLFKVSSNFVFSEIIITKCCSKIPPLNVVGAFNGNSLEVHKLDCPRLNKKDKLVVMTWDKEKVKKSPRTFRAKITMDGPFTSDCSPAIIAIITRYKGVISSFVLNKDKSSSHFNLDLILYVKNYSNIQKMANDMRNKGLIYSWKLI
ncbi:MAG: RelA/SpoT family protein [Mycoplasma sp.]